MRVEGILTRDGRFWLAEVPTLDAMTQGRTRKEALAMISDWVETMIDQTDVSARSHLVAPRRFELECSDDAALIALMLRRQREAKGLSLAQVAEKLGARSRNAYARYERGESVPTVERLGDLLRAVSDHDFVIRESAD